MVDVRLGAVEGIRRAVGLLLLLLMVLVVLVGVVVAVELGR